MPTQSAIPGTDSIIDLSHWNTVVSFEEVKQSGVSAVIHKASQALVDDPSYESCRQDALEAGLLWGAYHFGVQGHDPVEQADFLLTAAIGPNKLASPKLLALDWEWNNADTMTAEQAALFVLHVFHRTGRWPMLYTSAAFLASIPRLVPAVILKCDLWLTGFTNAPVIPHQWATKGYRIWQHGIGVCAGIDGQVDWDTFNGTPEELRAYFT
jgi:lysozyme